MINKVGKNYRFILGMVVGIIISSVGVCALNMLSSSEISYDNSKGGTSTNVQGAIEELYKKSKNCTTGSCSKVESNFYVGYTYNQIKGSDNYCVTGDEATCVRTDCYTSSAKTCPSGTIIDYIVSGTNTRVRFHVMYDNGGTLTMQTQKNTIKNVSWYSSAQDDNTKGPLTILSALESETSNWNNVENQTYTLGETVFKTNAYTGCSGVSCTKNNYLLPLRTAHARMITLQEVVDLGCTVEENNTCPIWMFNYLYTSISFGGTENDNTQNNGSYNYGYGTSSATSSNTETARCMCRARFATDTDGTTWKSCGSRTVIEVSK